VSLKFFYSTKLTANFISLGKRKEEETMEDDIIREFIKQKIINIREQKGVTYKFIAKAAGEGITPYDVAHLCKDNRKLGRRKLNKLKQFILNY
jgi:hypothetical protein